MTINQTGLISRVSCSSSVSGLNGEYNALSASNCGGDK